MRTFIISHNPSDNYFPLITPFPLLSKSSVMDPVSLFPRRPHGLDSLADDALAQTKNGKLFFATAKGANDGISGLGRHFNDVIFAL